MAVNLRYNYRQLITRLTDKPADQWQHKLPTEATSDNLTNKLYTLGKTGSLGTAPVSLIALVIASVRQQE